MKSILIFSAIFGMAIAALPSFLKVCHKSDPNLTQCIIDSVTSLKPKMVKGIPELKMPPLDPLPLEEIKLRSGANSAKIDANITNLLVWGPTGFEIINLKADVDKLQFTFRIILPHIYFKGDYDIDMNVLVLKYKGQGPITGNLTDMTVDVHLKGKVVKIDGKNYVQFRKFGINLNIGHSKLHLHNLFAGQAQLASATNDVISDNADVFMKEIHPSLVHSLSDKFTDIANIICKTFTLEELFPK